jgi:hypothetical protein
VRFEYGVLPAAKLRWKVGFKLRVSDCFGGFYGFDVVIDGFDGQQYLDSDQAGGFCGLLPGVEGGA